MPHDDNEKWHLPESLDVNKSPQAMSAALREQKALAQKVHSPLAHASPIELEMARAARMIEHLEKDYQRLKTQILIKGRHANPSVLQARNAIAARLAEHYAQLGNYEKAAALEPRKEYRQQYGQIAKAIDRPDEKWCKCRSEAAHVKQMIYSPRHHRLMALKACAGCKQMSVGEVPAEFHQQEAIQAKVAQMVRGLSPQEAKVRLKAAGISSEMLKQ
jgi:hypothetical protein